MQLSHSSCNIEFLPYYPQFNQQLNQQSNQQDNQQLNQLMNRKKEMTFELDKTKNFLIVDYGTGYVHNDIVHFNRKDGKYVIDVDGSNEKTSCL